MTDLGKPGSAESAWALIDEMMSDDGRGNPLVSLDDFTGVYCRRYEAGDWAARAALFRACYEGSVDAVWYRGHVRLVATGNTGGALWSGDAVSLDALERDAPDLAAALVGTHASVGLFGRAEDFLECARFWDALVMMERHGIDVTTAHAGTVICRECGKAHTGGLAKHLDDKHEMSVERYRRLHPVAPVSVAEAPAIPPLAVEW